MSKIEFRAWDKENKRMHYGGFSVHATGKIIISEAEQALSGISSPDNLILMMYTGIKDDEGNKIYEGDILKSFHFKDKQNKKQYLYHFIQWCDKTMTFEAVNLNTSENKMFLWVCIEQGHTEKIGNINENPELLK